MPPISKRSNTITELTRTTSYVVHAGNYQDSIPSNVTNVVVSEDVPQSRYSDIFKTFNKNEGLNKVHVTLPDAITEIQDRAFYQCLRIKSITIPTNVTKIRAEAFMYCYNLEIVDLFSKHQHLKVIDDARSMDVKN